MKEEEVEEVETTCKHCLEDIHTNEYGTWLHDYSGAPHCKSVAELDICTASGKNCSCPNH